VALGYIIEWYASLVACCVVVPLGAAQVLADTFSSRSGAGPVRVALHWMVALLAVLLSVVAVDPSEAWGRLPRGLTVLMYNNAAACLTDGWAVWTYYALRAHYRHLNRVESAASIGRLLWATCGIYTLATNCLTAAVMATDLAWLVGVNDLVWVALLATFILVAGSSYVALHRAVARLVTVTTRDYWKAGLRKLAAFVAATAVLAVGSGVLTGMRVLGDFAFGARVSIVDPQSYRFNSALLLSWAGLVFVAAYAWVPVLNTGARWGWRAHLRIRPAEIEAPTRYVFVASPKMTAITGARSAAPGDSGVSSRLGATDRRTSTSGPPLTPVSPLRVSPLLPVLQLVPSVSSPGT
jgi:hypothetical protein